MTNPELLEQVERLTWTIKEAQSLLWKANVKPDTLEGKAKALLEKAMQPPKEPTLKDERDKLQKRLIAGQWLPEDLL